MTEDLARLFDTNQVLHIMDVADLNRNGHINFEDLMHIGVQKKLVGKEDRLQHLFQQMDTSGKGCVTDKDIKRYLNVGTPKAKEIIGEVDFRNKGVMDYDDFVNVWVKRKRKPKERLPTHKENDTKKGKDLAGPRMGVQIGLKLVNKDEGVIVDISQKGLPAAEAGITAGDVIKKVNGKPIEIVDDFRQAGQKFVPGTRAIFFIQREGRTKAVTLRL